MSWRHRAHTGHRQLQFLHDGELRALAPGDAVFIPSGVAHRAIPGAAPMTILNFVMPAFDPDDECVVE